MKTSSENKWAFKVLAGNYISEEDLEGLGISADWHLYLSPTEPPSAAQCNQQMNAYDLIACPCCGGRATIIGTLKTCEWSVICTMCGLETAHMMQPKDAALAWNRRHAPDEEGGEANTQPARGEAVGVDGPKHEAWEDFEGDFLTNGVGYAPAATYKACREAFDAAWADNASSSGRIAEARRAAKSAFDKAHPPTTQQAEAATPQGIDAAHTAQGVALCSDCPPVGYPTDITRCTPCPRRKQAEAQAVAWMVQVIGSSGAVYRSLHGTEPSPEAISDHATVIPLYTHPPVEKAEQPASAAGVEGFAEFESLMNLVPDEYDPNIAKSEPAQAWVAGFNICRNEVVENIRKRTLAAAPQPATKESRDE